MPTIKPLPLILALALVTAFASRVMASKPTSSTT